MGTTGVKKTSTGVDMRATRGDDLDLPTYVDAPWDCHIYIYIYGDQLGWWQGVNAAAYIPVPWSVWAMQHACPNELGFIDQWQK